MKRVTDKRREELAIYSMRSLAFKMANPWCGRCKKRRTTDVHHELGRLGPMLLDEHHWKPLCRRCHNTMPGHSNSKGPRAND